jgi:pilus assembly protein FimV
LRDEGSFDFWRNEKVKKLPKTLAAATFLAPMGVAALGVGDIELHSALNQPLNAKIELVASRSEASSDIRVSLASPEAFRRAGVERYFYLSNIRFKPVVAPDGSLSVKVTSHDIIREPFLNFLVEVNWPQGRALKEFTVLLDPPVTLREAETVIQKAPAVRRSAEKSSSIKRSGGNRYSSSYSGRSGSDLVGAEYGPTKKNDTLWAVATEVNNDSSVSQEQMMMALYKKNPEAFYKKNVNALKRGQTLAIPTSEEARQLTRREARGEFSDHYKIWTAKVPALVSGTESSKQKQPTSVSLLPSAKEKDVGQLTLMTPADEEAASAAGLADQDSGAGGNSAASVADKAIEISETVRQENEDIQKRMAALEEQVSTMQRLLVLKDEQLATLQGNQISETLASDKVASEPVEETEATADIVAEVPGADQEEIVAESPSPVQETAFYEDPIYLGLGGLGLLVLGVVAIARRRKQALDEDFSVAESILVSADDSQNPNDELIAPVVDSSESEAGIPAESSFLSEFTPSDFDTLESDGDEVDPITEADVYLAYGRYQQAEDLVRQAIENDPENEEYKLKLLEIHFATEDKNAFLSLAKEIHAGTAGSDSDLWMRAVEMGQDICPEEPLFLSDQQDTFNTEEEESTSEEASLEEAENPFPFEETEEDANEDFTVEEEPLELPELESDEVGVNLETEEIVSDVTDEHDDNLIDFGSANSDEEEIDLLVPALEEETEELKAEETNEKSEEEDDGFSFDLEMVSSEEETETDSKSKEESVEVEGDLDFGDDIAASLTDMDEVETKLDLAKAYVDMEDEDAAKEILQEVMAQGNDEQKAEAQSLIDGLNG